MKATIVSDTLFKLKPVLSGELADNEKVFVKTGTEFELHSFLPAAGNHVRVALEGVFLGPENRNTWYAFNPDIKIDGQRIQLKVIEDTVFKRRPIPSGELADNEKVFVKTGTEFELRFHGQPEDDHVQVALANSFLGPNNWNTWYVFMPHIEVIGTELGNKPEDSNAAAPVNPKDRGKVLSFPGFSGTYYTNDPIITGGNFTWGEATHGGSRIPASADVVNGIIRVATAMEEIRKLVGNRPITVNSWYRDPATNRRVGGASKSRHLTGDAVDFVVAGEHPHDTFDRLNRWWGSKGGLASSTVFTHIDMRGFRARWSYGF